MAARKRIVTPVARTSAAVMDSHIPSTPQIMGRSRTADTWKTRVRRKDIAAETTPLPRAVKKDEPKIPKPANRKDRE